MPLVLPTPEQVAWADCEVGVIIHLDLQVFEPSYRFREQRDYHPSPQVFAPRSLDTDQWLATAAAAGARYAVLVAKHCSGFSLWPTAAHDYSVASSPWRGGRGDVVGDFVASCARYGLRPGLYYSTSCNAWCGVDNPGTVLSGQRPDQERYNQIVETQLTELWTRYGPLFEVWFDGGTLPPQQGGPAVLDLLWKLQPQAVCFQGPAGTRSMLRWVGNERAEAPENCWSTTNLRAGRFDGTEDAPPEGAGDPAGSHWAPAEADMPNRDQHRAFQGGWFWRAGEDDTLYSVEHLLERYYRSVGRNCNLLLGMVIDDQGQVPAADVARCTDFGAAVQREFRHPLGTVSGTGDELLLELPAPQHVHCVALREDLPHGERVRAYTLAGRQGTTWQDLASGQCIGHQRLIRLPATPLEALRLRITAATAPPQIRALAAYGA
ncbi:MAG: alpha-L-fucosidase [Fimbriimonadaceae bacterium]|nr:alpha-L-fucosidase [Fimbriimonadaceae bacterium]